MNKRDLGYPRSLPFASLAEPGSKKWIRDVRREIALTPFMMKNLKWRKRKGMSRQGRSRASLL